MPTNAQIDYIESLLETLDITLEEVLDRINYPSNIGLDELDTEIASEVIDELKRLQRQRI